jgi:hypothetical protein
MEIMEENIVLNDEQKKCIDFLKNFIKKGDPTKWCVLEGKAGVGKTTVISELLSEFIGKKRVMVSALSHKAKKVIEKKVTSKFTDEEIKGFYSSSVASMLGMSLDLETGKFTKLYNKKRPLIKIVDILIVDECSMINEEALYLIMSEKKKTCKVIFLGDVGQLPPIREEGDLNSGTPSPTFVSDFKIKLTERVRQSKDSDILGYSDFYWDNSVINTDPEEDPVPFEYRKDTKDIIFSTDLEKTLKNNEENFKKLNNLKQQDLIKVIVYKNKTREALNWFIRTMIYEKPKEYEVGDVLIFNDNYTEGGDDVLIENSTEVVILSVKEEKFHNRWDGYVLDVTDGDTVWQIDVLSVKSFKNYYNYISELFINAKKLPYGKERNRQLRNAWSNKRRFANIDFAYAITSHKSQGSTYKNVILVEDDILSVVPISNTEKSQSIYTAITRASDKVFIVSELNK